MNYKLLFLLILGFSATLTIYKLIKLIWLSLKKFIFKGDEVLISPKDLCVLTPKEFQSFSNLILEREGFSSLVPLEDHHNEESYFVTSLNGENYGVLCIKEDFASKNPSSINFSTFKRFVAILHHNNLSNALIIHSRELIKEKQTLLSNTEGIFNFTIYDGDILCKNYNLLTSGVSSESWDLK